MPLALLAGQTWAHEAPFSAAMLLPLAFSLMVAAPAFFPKADAAKVDALRVSLTVVTVIVALAAGDFAWRLGGGGFVLSPVRIGLVFGAAAFVAAFARERRGAAWNLAFALLALAALGHDAERVAEAAFRPGAWHAGAVSALAFLWWLKGRGCERAVGAAGVAILLIARAVEGAWPSVSAPHEFLRWLPAAALAISAGYGVRERLLRPALFMVVFAWGAGGLVGAGAPPVVYFFAALAALAFAAFSNGRAYAILLAVYPVVSAIVRWRTLPRTPGQWGAFVIACAFASLAAALAVTSLRIGRGGADALRGGGSEGGGS